MAGYATPSTTSATTLPTPTATSSLGHGRNRAQARVPAKADIRSDRHASPRIIAETTRLNWPEMSSEILEKR